MVLAETRSDPALQLSGHGAEDNLLQGNSVVFRQGV